MDFKKYNSIENSYRQKTIDYIVSQGLSGGEWVCLENYRVSALQSSNLWPSAI